MRKPLTLSVLLCAATACGGDRAPASVSVEELTSPAGPASGEPFLSTDGGVAYLSWLEAVPEGGHELRFARWDGAWSEVRSIAHSDRFFVNWADFPSITPGPKGTLWAHWLERGPNGGYDYGVRVVRSTDGGVTWSEPWTPHDDVSPTEHGFVSAFVIGDRIGFVWLDGRAFVEGPHGEPATHEMTLRFRTAGPDGRAGPETLVDAKVCDCCQTDAAVAESGPVVVYRDRTDDEIRDIHVTRFEDGRWTEGVPVHSDGWNIAGCPVNGPAVAAMGDDVAVAWFTGANDVPLVKVAFSSDGGRTFGAPIGIDDGSPAGRVDVLMLDDGAALVSWLERTGGEAAEVRVRRVDARGAGPSTSLTGSSAERASGFPRMIRVGSADVLLAWTDVMGEEPRVRLQRLVLEE